MKKWICSLLVGVLLCGLVGCGSAGNSKVQPVTKGFSCQVTVDYRELALVGELQCSPEGKLQLTFFQPSPLSGLSIGWDGQDMTMELGDVSVSVSPDKVPQSALIKSLLGVLSAKPANGEMTHEGYVMEGSVDGLAYTLVCDGTTGLPLSLSVPENELSATFTQTTIMPIN